MKMKLIDADALLDAISVHLERIEQEFDDAYNPMIEYVPVKHGRWVPLYDDVWFCSECEQTEQFAENIESTSRYCPNCGARMDGDENEID